MQSTAGEPATPASPTADDSAESSGPGRWFTRANGLTALRLATIPALVVAIRGGQPGIATALLTLAIATDFADGAVARRYGEASPLGGLLDHATDAAFVTAGIAALASLGVVPSLLAPLIAASFVQYVLDSRSLAGRPLRTSTLGRWNGIAYFVVLGTPLVRDTLGIGWPEREVVTAMGWVLMGSTVASMLDRLVALFRPAS